MTGYRKLRHRVHSAYLFLLQFLQPVHGLALVVPSFSLFFSLARCPRCKACLRFVLSIFLLCPRFNVGTQATLYVSQDFAACPETKCVPHMWSWCKIPSVRSTLCTAEVQRDHLSCDSIWASSPWFVTTEGTWGKYIPLSRLLLFPHPTTIQNTIAFARNWHGFVHISVHQYGGVASDVKI